MAIFYQNSNFRNDQGRQYDLLGTIRVIHRRQKFYDRFTRRTMK